MTFLDICIMRSGCHCDYQTGLHTWAAICEMKTTFLYMHADCQLSVGDQVRILGKETPDRRTEESTGHLMHLERLEALWKPGDENNAAIVHPALERSKPSWSHISMTLKNDQQGDITGKCCCDDVSMDGETRTAEKNVQQRKT